MPINDTTPACYGVLCDLHAECARYRTVDKMPAGVVVIGTCATPPGTERPLFVAIKEREAVVKDCLTDRTLFVPIL